VADPDPDSFCRHCNSNCWERYSIPSHCRPAYIPFITDVGRTCSVLSDPHVSVFAVEGPTINDKPDHGRPCVDLRSARRTPQSEPIALRKIS